MSQISYKEFIDKYKPVKNHLFPKALLDGCLYGSTDLWALRNYIQLKSVWSLVADYDTDMYTMQEEISYKLVPGIDANAVGFVATTNPYAIGDNLEVLLPSYLG